MYKILKEIKQSIKFQRLSDLFRNEQKENISTFHSNYLISFVIDFIPSMSVSKLLALSK